MRTDAVADLARVRALLASENERATLMDLDPVTDFDLCLGPIAGRANRHYELPVGARCKRAGALGLLVCVVSRRHSCGERCGTERPDDQQSDLAHATPLNVGSVGNREVLPPKATPQQGEALSASACGE